MVKNVLAMRETWAQSLGWEDPLEVSMVIAYGDRCQILDLQRRVLLKYEKDREGF